MTDASSRQPPVTAVAAIMGAGAVSRLEAESFPLILHQLPKAKQLHTDKGAREMQPLSLAPGMQKTQKSRHYLAQMALQVF